MEASPGQRTKPREFPGVTVAHLGGTSALREPYAATARLVQNEYGCPQLQLQREAEGGAGMVVHVALRDAQLFRVGPVEAICVSEGAGREGGVKAVSIVFRTEGQSSSFHDNFQLCRNGQIAAASVLISTIEILHKMTSNEIIPTH